MHDNPNPIDGILFPHPTDGITFCTTSTHLQKQYLVVGKKYKSKVYLPCSYQFHSCKSKHVENIPPVSVGGG